MGVSSSASLRDVGVDEPVSGRRGTSLRCHGPTVLALYVAARLGDPRGDRRQAGVARCDERSQQVQQFCRAVQLCEGVGEFDVGAVVVVPGQRLLKGVLGDLVGAIDDVEGVELGGVQLGAERAQVPFESAAEGAQRRRRLPVPQAVLDAEQPGPARIVHAVREGECGAGDRVAEVTERRIRAAHGVPRAVRGTPRCPRRRPVAAPQRRRQSAGLSLQHAQAFAHLPLIGDDARRQVDGRHRKNAGCAGCPAGHRHRRPAHRVTVVHRADQVIVAGRQRCGQHGGRAGAERVELAVQLPGLVRDVHLLGVDVGVADPKPHRAGGGAVPAAAAVAAGRLHLRGRDRPGPVGGVQVARSASRQPQQRNPGRSQQPLPP